MDQEQALSLLGITKEDTFFRHNEILHDSLEGVLLRGVFNFCGCGMPDDVASYILEGLKAIPDTDYDVMNQDQIDQEWARSREHQKSIFD